MTLTIRSIKTVGVELPMRRVLGTSQAAIRSAPLLLVDLETEEGITGHSYLFGYVKAAIAAIASVMAEVENVVKDERVAPVDLWATLTRRFMLNPVLAEPLPVVDGAIVILDRPGNGLAWDLGAVDKYRIV